MFRDPNVEKQLIDSNKRALNIYFSLKVQNSKKHDSIFFRRVATFCLFVLNGNAVCCDVRDVVVVVDVDDVVVVVDRGAHSHTLHAMMLFSSIILDRYLSVDCMKAFLFGFSLFFLTHKLNYVLISN